MTRVLFHNVILENEILMHLRANKKINNEVSLEDPIGKDKEGNHIRLVDVLGVDDESVIDRIQQDTYVKKINKLIETQLTKREKQVLKMRFAIGEERKMTQKEIAGKLGISRAYVSRIEKNAVEKLGKCMEDK